MPRIDVSTLSRMAFIHRASAHILAGWSPKVRDLSTKREMARHAYEDLEQVKRIESHIFAITRSGEHRSTVPAGLVRAMRAIDASRTEREMLVGLYGLAKRDLLVSYARIAASMDPILDATLGYVLPPMSGLLSRQLQWAEAACEGEDVRAIAAAFRPVFAEASSGEEVESDGAIWRPIDRVPEASRPEGMHRGVPGSMRLIPLDSSGDPNGIGLHLHNLINGEYTTMELVSRSLYEHADLPKAFHLHMARQAYDEARHAAALERAAAQLGVRYGDYPIYTLTYDGYYAFEPCEPGSDRELLWRLLLRGTIDEGLAVDDFTFQEKRRRHLGQDGLADLFQALMLDETFHVQVALEWSRYLCAKDEARLLEERSAANDYVMSVLDERRRAFVESHPEEAIDEIRMRRAADRIESAYALPFGRTMNLGARKAAGCTDADIGQIVGFGYGGLEA
jgi:uncharacterized ferritin-like protein (DUF455 family)